MSKQFFGRPDYSLLGTVLTQVLKEEAPKEKKSDDKKEEDEEKGDKDEKEKEETTIQQHVQHRCGRSTENKGNSLMAVANASKASPQSPS